MASVQNALAAEDRDLFIDLLPYANKGSYTVQEHTAAMRCYLLFRTMGLRHLPVLGRDHCVRGMLTRKDLLAAAEHDEVASCKSVESCPAASSVPPAQDDDNVNANAEGDLEAPN